MSSPFVARCVLNLVIAMSLVLAVLVGYRAGHQEPRATRIDGCALVLTQSGQMCR